MTMLLAKQVVPLHVICGKPPQESMGWGVLGRAHDGEFSFCPKDKFSIHALDNMVDNKRVANSSYIFGAARDGARDWYLTIVPAQ